jgi:mannose-6-phosphate isomerase class I
VSRISDYDKRPVVAITTNDQDCFQGWPEIFARIEAEIAQRSPLLVAIECYPGVPVEELAERLRLRFGGALVLDAANAYKSSKDLEAQFANTLTDDPVFGFMHPWTIADFFDPALLQDCQKSVKEKAGLVFVIGAGAVLLAPQADLVLCATLTRWQIQQRQRSHTIGNLGLSNANDSPSRLYKNAFFIDWRAADRLRHEIYEDIDFFLDLNADDDPRMLEGKRLRNAIDQVAQRPFRVVPFFDPGPWGGDWMRRQFDLPSGPKNYAWGFDCVPEENSVVLGFGTRTFELPASIVVHEEPENLLGSDIYRRFGAEFPIRFDLLDTMNGGNLSLQVHPLTQYIREHFGMNYTQDESYYILDCGENAHVYLGLRNGIDRTEMCAALERAEASQEDFDAERYVNRWPTRRHDHFSIPAGTIHCSGKDNVVLEISATPYIFTFKLWDWGRAGLDGKPRPIHLKYGMQNIQWDRDASWVEAEVLDQVQLIGQGEGWREERTGLHDAEFLETRRHWFNAPVAHNTQGTLNVVNLVQGEAVVVESPTGKFSPLCVHYAETFIVPASVGEYVITPLHASDKPHATIKAYVRRPFTNQKPNA